MGVPVVDSLVSAILESRHELVAHSDASDGFAVHTLSSPCSRGAALQLWFGGSWAFVSIAPYDGGFELDLEDRQDVGDLVALAVALACGEVEVTYRGGCVRPSLSGVRLPDGTRLKASLSLADLLRRPRRDRPEAW